MYHGGPNIYYDIMGLVWTWIVSLVMPQNNAMVSICTGIHTYTIQNIVYSLQPRGSSSSFVVISCSVGWEKIRLGTISSLACSSELTQREYSCVEEFLVKIDYEDLQFRSEQSRLTSIQQNLCQPSIEYRVLYSIYEEFIWVFFKEEEKKTWDKVKNYSVCHILAVV